VVLAYSFRCFTAVLTSHMPDGEDRNRLERKVSNLLQLALIPDGKVSFFSWLHDVLCCVAVCTVDGIFART
jgi:hypothetical protein